MADRYRVDCRKFPSDQGCTVAISGVIDEVVELGWLHAKTHHAPKDEEEKGIKDWIRTNAEAAAINVSTCSLDIRHGSSCGVRSHSRHNDSNLLTA